MAGIREERGQLDFAAARPGGFKGRDKVLEFIAHGEATTEVMLTHERVPDLYVGDFDAGWISTLEHLEKYLEAQRA